MMILSCFAAADTLLRDTMNVFCMNEGLTGLHRGPNVGKNQGFLQTLSCMLQGKVQISVCEENVGPIAPVTMRSQMIKKLVIGCICDAETNKKKE